MIALRMLLGFGLGLAMQYYWMPGAVATKTVGMFLVSSVFAGSITGYYLLWR